MRRASGAGAALLAVGLATDGCARTAPAPDPWQLPGVGAALEQSRDSAVRHTVQVVLTAGSRPLQLRSLQLLGGGFVQAPPTPGDYLVPAGARVAFPVPYGTALCEGRPAPVAVVAGTPSGDREVQVPSDTLLARLRGEECAQAVLAGVVTVRFEGLRRRAGAVSGELVLRRAGGREAVTLRDLADSPVFTARAGGLPAVLRPAAARLAVPVVLTADRCDPHRLVDSKRTYSFPVGLQVAGHPPAAQPVVPDEPAKALLDRLLQAACATPPP